MSVTFTPPEVISIRQGFEIHGVAFVEGRREPVGLTVQVSRSNVDVQMSEVFEAKEVYNVLRGLFRNYAENDSGLYKSVGLNCRWRMKQDKWADLLNSIGKVMGQEWKDAVSTVLSEQEKKS
jgi:uncharacterized membrane protein YdfJ with MMPL/SSD domain